MADVTPAHNGFNIGILVIRRQNLPQDRNAAIDGVVRDDPIFPYCGNQFVTAGERVLMGEEIFKEPGDPWLQVSGGFPVEQIAGIGVELPMAE